MQLDTENNPRIHSLVIVNNLERERAGPITMSRRFEQKTVSVRIKWWADSSAPRATLISNPTRICPETTQKQ